MSLLLWNILLALAWTALTGDLTAVNLLIGFILGYLILIFTKPLQVSPRYFKKVPKFFGLLIFFIWSLFLASLRVAYDIMTRKYYMRPGFLKIPLDAETNMEITLLGNLISLTPGTLTLDVSPDRKTLYIHAMYIDDPEKLKKEIKEGFEKRVLEVLR